VNFARSNDQLQGTTDPANADTNLDIYSALIGRRPVIDPTIGANPVEVHFNFKLDLKLDDQTIPARDESMKQKLGRWSAQALRGIEGARRRLAAARQGLTTTPIATRVKARPVVLIGPAARRKKAKAA